MESIPYPVQLPLPLDDKVCIACATWKPLSEFMTNGRCALRTCRLCYNAQMRQKRKDNPEQVRARERLQRRNQSDEVRQRKLDYLKRWREQHPTAATEWDRTNRERRRELAGRTRERNREKVRARTRAYYQQHPEKKRMYHRKRRAMKRGAQGTFTLNEWATLKAHYRFSCLCCHRQEPEITLTPDHVVPLCKGGSNGIENIQPLCLDCNMRKNAKTIDYRAVPCDS